MTETTASVVSINAAKTPKSPAQKRSVNWRNNLLGGARNFLSRVTGGSFNGKRDLYEAFGWDVSVDAYMLWQMYLRGGIARTLVEAYPTATWGQPPQITGNQSWTKAWDTLVDDQDLWSIMLRWDRVSQLGRYALLLVGLDDSQRLETPVNSSRTSKVLYLQPYSDRSAIITKWGTDPTDPRFGLPLEYTINPGLALLETFPGVNTNPVTQRAVPHQVPYRVHHSRVIHVAQNALENENFGQSILWAPWNYLTDLQKVVGGSSESYWMTANRGMHADIAKELELEDEDEAALTAEIDDYQDGLRRFIRTRGVTIKDLGSDVADPTGPFETLVTLIAGTARIPKRILLGSEAAHNASTQDKGNWAEHVDEYRKLTAQPMFLLKLVKAFMMMGVLPTMDPKKIMVKWPDAYRLSPLEEGQRANQRATAAANITSAVTNVPNLCSVEEMREMITLPRDIDPAGTKPEEPKQPNPPTNIAQTPGNGDGTTATPGSDSNGKGAPIKSRTTVTK